jgi:hypothetical protein
MLAEIHCDKFRETPVALGPRLNVVLGDNAATNSIGKSCFLMVIDFLMGGDTFLQHNSDVVDELGHHKYYGKFIFGNTTHAFCRDTGDPATVFKCTANYEVTEAITIDEYRGFLNRAYGTDALEMTFRAVVSPFCRIWGKDNLDPTRPLNAHINTKALDTLKLALHIYGRYAPLRLLEQQLNEAAQKKSALEQAQAQQLIPKISASQFKQNAKSAEEIDSEISDIKRELKKYATNIGEIASREVQEIKESKDRLLESRSRHSSRLRRIEASLATNSYIKPKSLVVLKKYFPQVDDTRLAEVESFHSAISGILRKELKASRSALLDNLQHIDTELALLDDRLSHILTNVENPGLIVDRVHALAKRRYVISQENDFREHSVSLAESVKEQKAELEQARKKQLSMIQIAINKEIEALSSQIYGPDRKSPYIAFSKTNYSYEIFEDTGTGRAYSNLVLFDIAVLRTTSIPTFIHDSLMFKNVENEVVAHMAAVYATLDRQVFVAIDEIEKYGKPAGDLFTQHAVLRLSDSKVLYVKDWRKKTASSKRGGGVVS